ncbi:MAG TPA: DUF1992 domain-containing protein [Pyrinomonadaceae bacterium]
MLKSVEEQIRKAMAEGEFDNLPGRGQPLSLEAYFSTPEHLRMAYSVLKSGDFVPQEVQMFRDIDDLKTRLNSSTDAAERERLQKQIREKKLNLTVLLEGRRPGR